MAINILKHTILIGLVFFASGVQAQKIEINNVESSVNWTGKKLTGEHTGTLSFMKGELVLNKKKLTGGVFEIDMNSITCTDIQDKKSNVRLIDHLKSDDFFSVRNNPISRLEITKAQQLRGDEYSITGNLTIKGTTQAVTFPATVLVTGGLVTAKAHLTFDRSKYNIKFGSNSFFDNLGDEMIYDDIDLVIQLTGQVAVRN